MINQSDYNANQESQLREALKKGRVAFVKKRLYMGS